MLSFGISLLGYVCLLLTTQRFQITYFGSVKKPLWNVLFWFCSGILFVLSLLAWQTAQNSSIVLASWLFYLLPLSGSVVVFANTMIVLLHEK